MRPALPRPSRSTTSSDPRTRNSITLDAPKSNRTTAALRHKNPRPTGRVYRFSTSLDRFSTSRTHRLRRTDRSPRSPSQQEAVRDDHQPPESPQPPRSSLRSPPPASTAATARPMDDSATPVKRAPAAVYSRQDRAMIPATTPASTPTTSGPRSEVVSGGGYGFGAAAPTVVRVVDGNSGFDWVDAAIGAAGGIALSMIGLGGALVVTQSRARHTRRHDRRPRLSRARDGRQTGSDDVHPTRVVGMPGANSGARSPSRVVALSTLVAVGVSVFFLAVTGASRTSSTPGHPIISLRPRLSIQYSGTEEQRPATRIHTMPATEPDGSVAVFSTPQSSKEEK